LLYGRSRPEISADIAAIVEESRRESRAADHFWDERRPVPNRGLIMEYLLRDLRFGLRTLLKHRWFTMLAVVTLGLGIGANTAIFSVIDGVLLKPLPYTNGERLLLVREAAPLAGRPNVGVSIRELYDYREQSRAFDALVEYHQMNFDLLKRGEPDRVNTGVVSHNFFDVLGITPILGRTFVERDDAVGADAVLVLSYSYWKTKFGGDPGIVGQVFEMNDRPHTVVGVLPNVPHYPQENDVYMPVSACPFRAAAETTIAQNRRNFTLTVFGRLKPGVSVDQAAKDVDVICGRFVHDDPKTYRPGSGFTATTVPVRDALTVQARPMLLILLATTGLVLLIACANVANLTLARLLRRDRELAVRTALGAGRAQLVRQLLTESVLLSLGGGALGLLFASSTLTMLTTFVGRFTARTGEIGIDPWVLGFTLLVSIATGIAFGTLPALSSRVDLVNAMKQGSRGAGTTAGKRRVQNGLIIAQVAVSVVLLVGAGLLLTSFVRLQQVDPGYRGDHVLTAQAYVNFTKYPNPGDHLRFYPAVLERLQGEPGVISAAVTDAVPLGAGNPFNIPFTIEGRAADDQDKRPSTDLRTISNDYFKALGIPLVAGRAFTDADRRDGSPVVIVNKAMLRYWDAHDPIGSRISIGNSAPSTPSPWATVVGVVGDVRQFGLDQGAIAQVYQPLTQARGLAGRFIVRTQDNPMTAAKMLRDDVHAVDPAMPVVNVRTLDDLRDRYLATPKLTALLLTIFAGLALLVTMAGLTGVIAASVTQRTQEFGLRMALGASRERVLGVVVGQGLTLIAVGLGLGFAASFALTRVLSAYLFNTETTDPVTFAGVVVSFVVAGVLACAGPAWRATRVDPMVALRAD
jgi:predicted permease